MARRNDHRPEELRSMALDAARAIASEEGLRGITVRRVAERIGYAPGTLYNLFPSLDALILTMNGETLERLGASLSGAAAAPVERRAAALVDAYFDFVEQQPRLWSVLFEHRLPEGTPAPDWYRAALERLVGAAVVALTPVISAFPEAERHQTVVAMWGALHGISTLAVSGKLGLVSSADPRQLAHRVVRGIVSAGPQS